MVKIIPVWLDRRVGIILMGSFLSSMSSFLVAPYLLLYLTGEMGIKTAVAGAMIGMSYWLLRAGGLFASALVKSFGYRSVMFWGGGLRIPGYFLLAIDNVWVIAIGLCLVGLGGGFYFPPSKALLIKMLAKDQQLAALSVRNITANLGVAIGPLLGTLGAEIFGLKSVVISAALCFTVLAILVSFLPNLKPDLLAESSRAPEKHSQIESEKPEPGGVKNTKPAAWKEFSRKYVLPLIGISIVFGMLLTQMETILPATARAWNYREYVGLCFTFNAILVVVLQAGAFRLVRYSFKAAAGFAGIFAGLFFIFLLPTLQSVLALFAAVFFLSGAEVLSVMVIEDSIRRYRESEITLAYGVQGVFDGVGGILGASLIPGLILGNSTTAYTGGSLAITSIAAITLVAFIVGILLLRIDHQENKHE